MGILLVHLLCYILVAFSTFDAFLPLAPLSTHGGVQHEPTMTLDPELSYSASEWFELRRIDIVQKNADQSSPACTLTMKSILIHKYSGMLSITGLSLAGNAAGTFSLC